MRPIVEIMFGDFLTLAADQLLNHAAKYRWVTNRRVDLPLVIRTPMGGGRGYGPTHSQSIEKMFMGIPGLAVVAPSNLVDPGELLRRAVTLSADPVLFVEHKLLYPKPLLAADDGRVANFFVKSTASCYPTVHLSLTGFDAPDLILLTYGGTTPLAMHVAETLLLDHEIVADVVVPSLLSPPPYDEIQAAVAGCTAVATIEEGTRGFDWGAEMIAGLAERLGAAPRKYMRFASAPCPIPAAIPLEKRVLPDAGAIIDAIRRSIA
jgi:pyruvate/2-oxoglutarate/acetoin dehydrogenase E1 component